MRRKIRFSLLYRDMWQSSGKYQPRVDQLKAVAPYIVEMGCFDRIETNGGAFEQVQLLFGENPNTAVREWTKPFKEAGIETHMLEQALNGIRMYPVPADLKRLMFRVKKAQGANVNKGDVLFKILEQKKRKTRKNQFSYMIFPEIIIFAPDWLMK